MSGEDKRVRRVGGQKRRGEEMDGPSSVRARFGLACADVGAYVPGEDAEEVRRLLGDGLGGSVGAIAPLLRRTASEESAGMRQPDHAAFPPSLGGCEDGDRAARMTPDETGVHDSMGAIRYPPHASLSSPQPEIDPILPDECASPFFRGDSSPGPRSAHSYAVPPSRPWEEDDEGDKPFDFSPSEALAMRQGQDKPAPSQDKRLGIRTPQSLPVLATDATPIKLTPGPGLSPRWGWSASPDDPVPGESTDPGAPDEEEEDDDDQSSAHHSYSHPGRGGARVTPIWPGDDGLDDPLLLGGGFGDIWDFPPLGKDPFAASLGALLSGVHDHDHAHHHDDDCLHCMDADADVDVDENAAFRLGSHDLARPKAPPSAPAKALPDVEADAEAPPARRTRRTRRAKVVAEAETPTARAGGKKHSCKVCGYATDRSKALRDHMNAVHKGLKPYSCDQCGQTFRWDTSLCKHRAKGTCFKPGYRDTYLRNAKRREQAQLLST